MSHFVGEKKKFLKFVDASGNQVTQIIQNVGVTDPSGNPVTGKVEFLKYFKEFNTV